MDIRPLTTAYAVAPQIEPGDLAAIRAAGFVRVINNRPDGEIPLHLRSEAMAAAAAAAGIDFVSIPLIHGQITPAVAEAQRAACESADGPVLAYCASGNRCSIVWALGEAGRRPVEELIATAARHGYRLDHLRPVIEALAAEA